MELVLLVSGDKGSKMGMTKFTVFETLTKLNVFYSQTEEKQVFLKKKLQFTYKQHGKFLISWHEKKIYS